MRFGWVESYKIRRGTFVWDGGGILKDSRYSIIRFFLTADYLFRRHRHEAYCLPGSSVLAVQGLVGLARDL